MGEAPPSGSPWLVDGALVLHAARGEILGLQVFHRAPGSVALSIAGAGAAVRAFAVEPVVVDRPSTSMYGGSQGAGAYPEALTLTEAPTTSPSYLEVAVARDATPGVRTGELVVAGQRVPVTLTIHEPVLPPLRLDVWAYFDQRELAWAAGQPDQPVKMTPRDASEAEVACVEMFRSHGVLLAPDLTVETYTRRKSLLFDFPHVPAMLSTDPVQAADEVRAWIAATAGTGQVPFAIPIDEPGAGARGKVRALAEAVRAAGGGPDTFRFAVTDEPRPEYGDVIDLYIHWNAARLDNTAQTRWTYNGKPPRAGSMVLDTATPGMRTWGWIAHRYRIPVWYVWDALYWHDRHNRKGTPLPGRAVEPARDAVSFDDGEDHGNLDGVLALPDGKGGCRPTLRLASLRRGLQDRALLEAAARCKPAETAKLAAELIPKALGDAPSEGPVPWPTDEAAWERARRQLLELASCARPSD